MNFPQSFDDAETETVESREVCEKHGEFVAKTYSFAGLGVTGRGITTGCPVCSAERRKAEEDRKTAIAREALRKDKEAKIERLLWRAGIPARFADKSFSGYVPTSQGASVALRAAKGYAETFIAQAENGRSLVFAGGPGSGKTHLASAIGLYVIREFQSVVLFGTISSILRAVKETYRKDAETTETSVLAALSSADLLILDEIGVQVGSEHEKQLMFEILNERYQNLKPTILISNLNTDELETFLGHRVMDRYRECGVVLAFDWESHRGKPAIDAKTQAAGGES